MTPALPWELAARFGLEQKLELQPVARCLPARLPACPPARRPASGSPCGRGRGSRARGREGVGADSER